MLSLPHAPATERNREPILEVLRSAFAGRSRVLEIGSGTGEHAVFFAAALPELVWQTSDRADNLPGIRAWLDHVRLPNLPPPLQLDVYQARWPEPVHDAAFSANTLHIMAWDAVEALFAGLNGALAANACLVVYGPFKIGGQHTSPSNAAFDAQLRRDDPRRGVRDLEAVDALARAIGFIDLVDHSLPANNRCLVWRRGG